MYIDLNADPVFQSNADPDPASNNTADPDPQPWLWLINMSLLYYHAE
jgi:hypothetical protein